MSAQTPDSATLRALADRLERAGEVGLASVVRNRARVTEEREQYERDRPIWEAVAARHALRAIVALLSLTVAACTACASPSPVREPTRAQELPRPFPGAVCAERDAYTCEWLTPEQHARRMAELDSIRARLRQRDPGGDLRL